MNEHVSYKAPDFMSFGRIENLEVEKVGNKVPGTFHVKPGRNWTISNTSIWRLNLMLFRILPGMSTEAELMKNLSWKSREARRPAIEPQKDI